MRGLTLSLGAAFIVALAAFFCISAVESLSSIDGLRELQPPIGCCGKCKCGAECKCCKGCCK